MRTLSLKMRRKFVEDFRLPIKIFDSPCFEYFIDLYKVEFKIEDKLAKFLIALDNLGEEDLSKSWYNIKDQIKSNIERQAAYEELSLKIFDNKKQEWENGHPYNMECLNKTCVSIDIITANYTALKEFDESLVLNTKNYKELISLFTPYEYFHDSKIFRQLAFEPLLAKKQGQIQKQITLSVAEYLKDKVNAKKIKTVSNDELVLIFDHQSKQEIDQEIKDVLSGYEKNSILKVETFEVKHITSDYFYKENLDGSFLLRKAPGQLYPQLFKKVKEIPVTETDLLFIDGETKQLAQFKKPLFSY